MKKVPKADPSAIPLDLLNLDQDRIEEVYISETFIDYKTNEGEVISCSVEKKGSKNHFTYTHKLNLKVKGQKLLKKKNISAAEYIQAKTTIKKGTHTLRTKRLCIIDNGVYIIVDYFPENDEAYGAETGTIIILTISLCLSAMIFIWIALFFNSISDLLVLN